MPTPADILKRQFSESLGLPWIDILPSTRLDEILKEEAIDYRNRVFTPVVTLWAMLYQSLAVDKSLRHTLKCLTAWLTAAGVEPPSSDTGAFSKARQRLPESLLHRLVPETADRLEQRVPQAHHWCGRPVKVFDGTTVQMADTPANQGEYPQHSNQAEGCGFPLAQVVVFFCLMTGAVVAASVGAWQTSEIVLSRLLYRQLAPGDVAVADQAYGSYVDLALIQQQGADGVLRKHHARRTDFRKGRKHGIGDHQVPWHKPVRRPVHLSEDEFAALPNTLMVREVCLRLCRPGFRPQSVIVVTTLLDAKRYTANQLTHLYGWRWWAAEVNLRHLKSTLGMEMINAKTPEMVRKQMWAHLLGYNLLRSVMEQAAPMAGYARHRLSLQGTRQQFRQDLALLAHLPRTVQERVYTHLLETVAADLLPVRPHRQEPRVVKRRPKSFPRMRQPRSVLKAKLAA